MLRLLVSVQPIDVVILAILAAVVVGITALLIVRKKKGIIGCGCGCKTCPHASACPSQTKEEEKEDETA